MNIISIHKDKFYDYKEYHTSLDNLDFVNDFQIMDSLSIYKELIEEIEKQDILISKSNFAEPMLSKYKLYPKTGGSLKTDKKNTDAELDIILWLLFLCDGKKTLHQIMKKLGVPGKLFFKIVDLLLNKKLINYV